MRMLLLSALTLVPGIALAQGVSVTPKPCASGQSEIGGLCVGSLASAPVPPDPGQTTCQGTQVAAGADIQAAINGAQEGATLCLAGALYRVANPLNPKKNQVLWGQGSATAISAAKVLTGWVRDGSDYRANGFLPSSPATDPDNGGRCDIQGCVYREDVYRDGVMLKRVLSRAALSPGKVYADYGANKIYIRDDPAGHTLEQNATRAVIYGSNPGATIKNLRVEGGANAEQTGGIDCHDAASFWTIDTVDIRNMHGAGINCDSFTMRKSHVHHNGQLGISGHGDNIVVEDTEIDHNNTAGYNDGWEGGGTKFSQGPRGAQNGLLQRNNVHDNLGAGLWCDINCYKWRIVGNTVTHNRAAGIFYEISHTCEVTGNTVSDNAWEFNVPNGFYNQADILISASPNCEVHANNVKNFVGIGGLQQNRNGGGGNYGNSCSINGSPNFPDGTPICEPNGDHLLKGLWVHDNNVTPYTTDSLVAGISQDINDMAVFTSRNNRFANNTYINIGTRRVFNWNNQLLTYDEWKAAGQN